MAKLLTTYEHYQKLYSDENRQTIMA